MKPGKPTQPANATVGLIGVGLLGTALAQRLLAAGFSVIGFDEAPARRRALAKLGGIVANSPDEVAASCARLVLSLPNSKVVATVIKALGASLRKGMLVIDTTTGAPADTESLAAQLSARGLRYLDATILGSSTEAAKGNAVVLVGGVKRGVNAANDVLAAIGKQVFHVGPCGGGSRMKLVMNLVLGLNRAVLAEGLAFAKKAGVDQALALEIMKSGAAYSRVMDSKGEKMLKREFAPQARLAQHLKDVKLIVALGKQNGAKLPLSTLHKRLLSHLAKYGHAESDNSAIIEAFA